jgi:TonB family protein
MNPRSLALATIALCPLAWAQPCASNPVADDVRPHCEAARTNQSDSLAHFRIGQFSLLRRDFQNAANSFREALSGNLQPAWIEVWSHLALGRIFRDTGQFERAANEYRLAIRTGDDAYGAMAEAKALLGEASVDVEPPPSYVRPDLQITGSYTAEAQLAELEGTVVLEASLDVNGVPQKISVLRGLGLDLDRSSIETVRGQKFASADVANPDRKVLIAVNYYLPGKTSRWHLVGVEVPHDASRPEFARAAYPPGSGIFSNGPAIEHASVIAAIGRPASIALTFEVDEHGRPVDIRVLQASHELWRSQAAALVQHWQFKPGAVNSTAPTRCTVRLLWGPRTLEPKYFDRYASIQKPHDK